MTSIKPIMGKLFLRLTKPTDYMKQREIEKAFYELVDKIERGIANPENPLDELDKAYKSKTKKTIKEKPWFGEINNEIQAVCKAKRNVITQHYQQTSSSPVPKANPPGGSKQKQTQNTGNQVLQDSVPLGGKGQTGEQLLEKSRELLKEVCDVIACEATPGSNTDDSEGIYLLAVSIKTKILKIECQCLDISKQIDSLRGTFGVRREVMYGGIASMPLWKNVLGDILIMKSDTNYPERIQRKIEAQVAVHENVPQQNVTPHSRGPMPETHTATDIKERSSFTGQEKNTTEKHEENAHTLKKDVDDLKSKLKGETEVNKKLRNDVDSIREQNRQLLKEFKKLQKELQSEHRMSKVSSSKLADHNPGITDLSDPNRITRLADIFCEIYENVGTDSLEALIGKNRMRTEKEAVLHMASILKVCYSYCKNKSDETLEQMEGVLLLKSQKNGDVGLDKEEHKQLKDMLKSTGVRTSKCLNQDDLIKCVLDRNLEKDMQKYHAFTKDFTQQCLEICWLMVVHDPPVVLYWGDLTVGSPIDADRFKSFTRSGEYLEYVVWPALLLHTNGPLLKKGIVQPQQSI